MNKQERKAYQKRSKILDTRTRGKINGKENIPKKNHIPDDFLNFEDSPWEFDLIVENIDIEKKFIGLRETLYKPKNKSTSFNYGIIDLNDQNIQIELGTSVIKYFEEFLDRYKPKNTNTKIATQLLRELNVTGLENLADSLTNININYKSLDEDILYLKRDLPEGWYNSNIITPLFDDCMSKLMDFVLWRGEIVSKIQKAIVSNSKKRKKYDGIMLFTSSIELIYMETATTTDMTKKLKDLSKLYEAISIMFSLPPPMRGEVKDIPILAFQFLWTRSGNIFGNLVRRDETVNVFNIGI